MTLTHAMIAFMRCTTTITQVLAQGGVLEAPPTAAAGDSKMDVDKDLVKPEIKVSGGM